MTTTLAIDEVRLAEVRARGLEHGAHKAPEQGLCAMEAVAYVLGLPHSDHPDDLCPVIADYVRRLNDAKLAFRAALIDKLPTICGGLRDATLEPARRRVFILAAIDCAELALPLYEKRCPDDKRPREALRLARDYLVRGEKLDDAQRRELRAALRSAASAASAAYAAYAADAADAAYAYAAADAASAASAAYIQKQIVERCMRALDEALAVAA